MNRRRRSSRPTQETCYNKDADGRACSDQPRWMLETERGNKFKVCDGHLAWGLRFSGLPALVTEHEPVTQNSLKALEEKLGRRG